MTRSPDTTTPQEYWRYCIVCGAPVVSRSFAIRNSLGEGACSRACAVAYNAGILADLEEILRLMRQCRLQDKR